MAKVSKGNKTDSLHEPTQNLKRKDEHKSSVLNKQANT